MISLIWMGKLLKVVSLIFALLILFGFTFLWAGSATADDVKRTTTLIVPYTEYEWWLISWDGNEIECRIFVDHEGLPTSEEVFKACGAVLHYQWQNTPACDLKKKDASECVGLYLHLVSSQAKKKEVIIELPEPVVWVNLEGCTPRPPDNLCLVIPILVLTGEEPLPEEEITAIRGTYDGQSFVCDGNVCKLQLHPSPLQGSLVEFWAESSYGDTSPHFTAIVRVIDTGVSSAPGGGFPNGGGWYIDVISDQWQGAPLETCSRYWQSLPPYGGAPAWLSTPDHSQILASGDPYYYLAGRLISQGLVDVSTCPGGGLQPNGYADVCGLEKAKPLVQEWQNQFDQRLVDVSRATGVPAQLMKNLFAQESQFWPGMYRVPFEFGLGQITEKGADAILLWNSDFYNKYCPLVLASETCAKGYLRLSDAEKDMLRGSLAFQANADCLDCPTGVDLNEASFSVSLFANTLKASCAQVGQMVLDATQKPAGTVATYEDLWRITVANYHAGSGCTAFALHMAWQNTSSLTWEQVSAHFTEPCKGVVPYVNKISQYNP